MLMNTLCPAAGHVQRASTASVVRIARHQAPRRLAWRAYVRWQSDVAKQDNGRRPGSLASECSGCQLSVFLVRDLANQNASSFSA